MSVQVSGSVRVISCFSGAVCPSGPVPLSRLSVVSAGQEGQGGRLLVRPGHRTSIQQAGERRFSILSLADKAAQPAEGAAAGEVDRRGRGQWDGSLRDFILLI